MAKGRQINVQFPLGGENRRGGYAQNTQPFTTPRAINVRSVGPLEKRGRGGSRPGMSKLSTQNIDVPVMTQVSYVDLDGTYQEKLLVINQYDGDGDGYYPAWIVDASAASPLVAYLVTDDGDYIITDDGDYIIFNSEIPDTPVSSSGMAQKGGSVYFISQLGALRKIDMRTNTITTLSNAPSGQTKVSVYQERIVLSGATNVYYMSAVDDDNNWTFAYNMDDVTRAVAGRVGLSEIGGKITAQLVYEDNDTTQVLLFGTSDSLWALYGNPAGKGRMVCVSRRVGPLSTFAMTVTPNGLVVFLSRHGLYTWTVGSEKEPAAYSAHVIPKKLLNTDVSITGTNVLMEYDHRSNGVYLFMVPFAGSSAGTHWWLDLEHRALWSFVLPAAMQPITTAKLPGGEYSDVVLACYDGYLRRFDNTVADDDGTAITSDLLLGPFHVSRAEGMDGLVTEIVSALAVGGGYVTWKLFAGTSAEAVVDAAEAALDGNEEYSPAATGTWVAGQNSVAYPRARGPWSVLWLSSTDQWSYEAVSMAVKKLGRLR